MQEKIGGPNINDHFSMHKTVAIFGAGVAGLSAAHEFSRLGYRVTIYESNSEVGGFFRSARETKDQGMPSEYSWHGFGPWYHNTYDIMKQIPFDDHHSVYDKCFSRPINYGIAHDQIKDADVEAPFRMLKRFRMTSLDKLRWAFLLFKTWSSNHRTKKYYSKLNAAEAWEPIMSNRGWKTWRSTFGPWVGSDWTRVSLHHVGQFFRRNLMAGRKHEHKADEQGGKWSHDSGDGWLLLRGPSSEFWFDKWVKFLKGKGVKIVCSASLAQLKYDGEKITGACLESGKTVHADIYVLAINPFAAAEIFDQTPALAAQEELRLFRPLIKDGPHTQVSFRLAFSERVAWPKERSAFLLPDSEFDLTLFPEEQVWSKKVSLGEEVLSLWTGTACVASVPGKKYGLPLSRCTKEQFIEEVKDQLFRCEELNLLLKEANQGRELKDFSLLRIEVWHEWKFSSTGIKPRQPKWVMSNHTQPFLPNQKTPVPNLLLAGAHTKTEADIWSIEAAVESGRRAVRVLEPDVRIIDQYKPFWLRAISAIDDIFFRFGLPHAVDVFFWLALAGVILSLALITRV